MTYVDVRLKIMSTVETVEHRSEAAIVIGLGGVTCGGKTSIAKIITSSLPNGTKCKAFHQDDYYWPEDHPHWKYDGTDNWDEIAAFDMDSFVSDAKQAMSQCDIVVVEGIMLYEDLRMRELIDCRLFITLPFDICKSRRVLRNYVPPEPYPEYFEVVYWPMYQQQLLELHTIDNLTQLDSTQSLDSLQQQVIQLVMEALNSK